VNDLLQASLRWADAHSIDLTDTHTQRGPRQSWEINKAGLKITFYQNEQTHENFRNLKRGLGGRFPDEPEDSGQVDTKAPDPLVALLHIKPSGQATLLDKSTVEFLKSKMDYDFQDCVLVQWYGAYTCTATDYDCKPGRFKDDE
jgi:hypothetical protein